MTTVLPAYQKPGYKTLVLRIIRLVKQAKFMQTVVYMHITIIWCFAYRCTAKVKPTIPERTIINMHANMYTYIDNMCIYTHGLTQKQYKRASANYCVTLQWCNHRNLGMHETYITIGHCCIDITKFFTLTR